MATLTSTGAANLTTSTNWSPAQIPADGDTLIIGNGVLTLNADKTFNSITFNHANARIATSGLTRTVQATNGWIIPNGINFNSGGSFFLSIEENSNVTLIGKWEFYNSAALAGFTLIPSGVFTLNMSTVGNNPSETLLYAMNGTVIICNIMNCTLNTTGLIFGIWNTTSSIINISNGSWTHNSVGDNMIITNGSIGFQFWSNSNVDITGNIYFQGQYLQPLTGAMFDISSCTGNININGDLSIWYYSHKIFDMREYNSGVVTFTGNVNTNPNSVYAVSNSTFAKIVSGTLLWQNQEITIPSNHNIRIDVSGKLIYLNGGVTGTGGILSISGLSVNNYGRLIITNENFGEVISDANTVIRNYLPMGQAAAVSTIALDGKILAIDVDAPILPEESLVASGTEYGYAGFEQTGTGLIMDPETLSDAILLSIAPLLQSRPSFITERSSDDDKALTFSWPNSTDTISAEVSIDTGSYIPVSGTISYLRPEGTKHYFTLSYSANDRPSEEGTARYRFYSNNHTMYATLRVTRPYTEELANAVALMNSKLSSSTISIISPLSSDGTTLNVIQGDDYLTVDNRNILFTGDVTDQWLDLTDSTVIIGVYGTSISKECVVISATGMQQISLELTSSDTNIPQGTYDYDVQATLSNGSVITLFRGKFTCSKSYTN